MSKLRDAAQQALEALKKSHPYSNSDRDLDKHSEAIHALRAALAEQPAEQEPVAWEWRWFDASPYTVTSGQWSEWKRVEPRNSLCTLDDALNEFRAYIANGLRYELRAIYTAPQPKREPVEATPYNLKRIAWELERTALGDGFYGNALRVAKDIPGIRLEDRSMLDRYATGTQTGTDHVHLQWLVQALYNTDDSKNGVQP